MTTATSGINYKNGKYLFGGIKKRDMALLALSIIISVIIVFNSDHPLPVIKAAFYFNIVFFLFLIPSSIFKSNYLYLYYFIKYMKKPKKLIWKGLIWNKDE